MMIEESETPGVGSQSDASADVLAARRARRAEAGDPVVVRRAEAAEAAIRNLETHLAALEQRLEEVGSERERIAQQLTEREREVRSVKQREYAEQQLRVEAEERGERAQREMRAQMQELHRRLDETEQRARELAAELEDVRRELSEAHQAMALGERLRERSEELRERLVALEGRFTEMQREVAVEREAREHAERELVQLRERDARLTPLVCELMEVASELRVSFERELAELRDELQRQVIWERETYVRELTAMGARMEDLRFELTRTAADLRTQLSAEPAAESLLHHTIAPESEREAAHRQEMADALVVAVERLRARVAEVKEIEQAESRTRPTRTEPPTQPVAEPPTQPVAEPPTQPVAESPAQPIAEPDVVWTSPASGPAPPPAASFTPTSIPTPTPTPAPAAGGASVVWTAPAGPVGQEESVLEPEQPAAHIPTDPVAPSYSAPVEEPETPFESPAAFKPLGEQPVPVETPPPFQPPVTFKPLKDEPTPVGGPEEPAPVEGPAVFVQPAQEPAAVEAPTPVEQPSPVPSPQVESESTSETLEEEPPVEEELLAAEESVAVAAPAAVEHSEPFVDSPPNDPDVGVALAARSVTPEPVVLQQRPLSIPEESRRISWLAPAIRRLAEQRDAKLAAELVIELLPAQRQVVDGALGYEIKIDELGTFYVTLEPSRGTVSREGSTATVDFSLEGSAAALSELAGGGASRRQPGLRIRKGRRRARRLLKARRRPLALADLANAGIDMWPGLLLLAMAEAIDPSWTAGRRFELAFEILDSSGVVIYVRICDGEPILVSRTATGKPVANVSVTEHGLMCLLGGTPAPPEDNVLLRGDATSVEMFLQWTARAQGLS
jgi:hypothetical protein